MRKILLPGYRATVSLLGKYKLGRFYPINKIHKFVLKNLKSKSALVLGHKMVLDSKDQLRLSINGIYEEFETKLIDKEIKAGDVVLDIGANIGYYTLIFARLVGKNGKVYAFEPDPTNFNLLKKNIEINGYDNVILVQKAVSDKNEKIKLFLAEKNTADHRIYNSDDGRKFVEIESVKLDDFLKDQKINFVKIDIQGAEGTALQGMSNLLNQNKKMKIISEFWPIGLRRCETQPRDYLKLLEKNNFEIKEVNEKEKTVKIISPQNLLETYTPEKNNYTNLLCIRNE